MAMRMRVFERMAIGATFHRIQRTATGEALTQENYMKIEPTEMGGQTFNVRHTDRELGHPMAARLDGYALLHVRDDERVWEER